MNDAELLAEYERQVRRPASPGPGWGLDSVLGGRVVALVHPEGAGSSATIVWSDLDESSADADIAAVVRRYDALGKLWEWKTFGYDRPADLGDRLAAAGFTAGAVEAVVIGETSEVVDACGAVELPDGVTIRPLRGLEDVDAIVRLADAAFGADMSWLASALPAMLAADPDALHFFLAEDADGELVSAGWVHLLAGTDFAGLYGGGTLERWRGRGLYRAIVSRRASLAAERGRRFVHVDALPTSRPILERVGLRQVTTTRPYERRPGGAA